MKMMVMLVMVGMSVEVTTGCDNPGDISKIHKLNMAVMEAFLFIRSPVTFSQKMEN